MIKWRVCDILGNYQQKRLRCLIIVIWHQNTSALAARLLPGEESFKIMKRKHSTSYSFS